MVPVRAVTVTTEVRSVPELVMNDLAPLTTHWSPSRVARVRVAPASEPAPGSVSPNAASARPATRSGRKRSFCSWLPIAEDRVDPEADAGAQRDAHRLVDAAELLDGDDQRHEVGVRPAELLGHDEAEQAEVTHLGDELGREVAVTVPLCDVRRDLRFGEVPHHRAEVLVLLAQLVHRRPSSLEWRQAGCA